MPIKPNALPPSSDSDPDEPVKDPQTPGTGEEIAQDAQVKRTRRTKDQMVADAVVPADHELVVVKDLGTGAKVERSWLEAVALVESGKAEWADKGMKYALLKYKQQSASEPQTSDGPASQEPTPATDAFGRPSPEQLEAAQLPTDTSGQMVAPEGASYGDEVVVGATTYRVGPGGALVKGVVDEPAKLRWQRELGTGGTGPWESKPIVRPGDFSQPAPSAVEATKNGDGPEGLDVQTERLPRTVETLEDGMIKIGTGILEKVGMPQIEQFASASQLQIGPITMSREVFDDGRRNVVTFSDGRQGEVISAAVEGFELLDNTCEFVAARFRGQLHSFLAATGAATQPAV